jgi:hypothetical protein
VSDHVIVFDLETIPDLEAVARIHGCQGKSETEIRELLGEKFPRLPIHQIVCIGAAVAQRVDGVWLVDAIGAPHLGERSEPELITRLSIRSLRIVHNSLPLTETASIFRSPSHCKERRILRVGEQHLRPHHPACPLTARPRNCRQLRDTSSLIASSTVCRHLAMMPILVRPTANEESTNKRPVPNMPVSRKRSSRERQEGRGRRVPRGPMHLGIPKCPLTS